MIADEKMVVVVLLAWTVGAVVRILCGEMGTLMVVSSWWRRERAVEKSFYLIDSLMTLSLRVRMDLRC